MIAAVPAVASVFISHGQAENWTYVTYAIVLIGAVGGWIGWMLRHGNKMGGVQITPSVAFIVITALILAVGLEGVAGAGKYAFYQPLFILIAVFIALIGDLSMQAWGWCVLMAVLTWSSWSEGLRGGNLLVLLMVTGSVSLVCQAMVARAVSDLSRRAGLRSNIGRLLEKVSNASTLEQGLSDCVPMVSDVLPASRVIAFFRRSGEEQFLPVSSWPSNSPSDDQFPGLESFSAAVESQRSIVENGFCFIPAGQTLSGSVMLVVDRSKSRRRSMAFVKEATEAIASIFLRLSGNTWYVAELKTETETDPLTHIANRRGLEERLATAISRAESTGEPLTVAMIDIDHFKRYNDEYGHQTGDRLLEAVALAMSGHARPGDLVCRFGGEEFCILMPGTELAEGVDLMESLRSTANISDGLPPITFSVGVAAWDKTEDIIGLLHRADKALYTAKEEGRDRVLSAVWP